jgi:NADH-quinone oxidoreductase subunit K
MSEPISLNAYLLISLLIFIGGLMMVLAKKHTVAMLIGLELILNASALNFVAYSKYTNGNVDGDIFALFIICVAAAESAVGLAIVIRFFQNKETIHIDEANQLKN